MSEILGIPFPTNRGRKNHVFGLTSQLKGNFNGLYLQNEIRCRQSVNRRWQLQRVSYIIPKCHELWFTNSL